VQSVLEYASQAARGYELSDPVPASNGLSRAWGSRRNSASSCDEFNEPAKWRHTLPRAPGMHDFPIITPGRANVIAHPIANVSARLIRGQK